MSKSSASVSRASSSKRTSKEAKGNVIVSVRVRPDPSGNDSNRAEGEWLVDGRSSLVAYKGREGGDHYYGQYNTPRSMLSIVRLIQRGCQITYSHHMTIMHAYMIPLLRDWFVE